LNSESLQSRGPQNDEEVGCVEPPEESFGEYHVDISIGCFNSFVVKCRLVFQNHSGNDFADIGVALNDSVTVLNVTVRMDRVSEERRWNVQSNRYKVQSSKGRGFQ